MTAHSGAIPLGDINYSGFAADYAAKFDRQKMPAPARSEAHQARPRGSAALLEKLEGVKPSGEGRWRARCPSHHGKSASLAIREEPDGRLLIKCFAECATADVLAAVGLSLADLFPERIDHNVPKIRRAFDAMQVLRSVADEVQIVACVCADIVSNRGISMMDFERVELASERLWSAVEVTQ